MIKILLVCSAGMSTSLLEKRMEEYINEKKYEIIVNALDSSSAKKYIDEYDVVLLGPQVRFMLTQFKNLSTTTPIDVIPMRMYGTMDGKNTVDFALKVINDNK